MLEIDALARGRVLRPSPCLQSSVCPNSAYGLRRDAWAAARRSAAAVRLQAAARVLHSHSVVRQALAAELLQRAWRQHAVMTRARAAGGKIARVAAVRIQSSWRGHWLRVKKVRGLILCGEGASSRALC